MENLTIVIPFFNGYEHIQRLLDSLPTTIPTIVVDDHSDRPLVLDRENTVVHRPSKKGYFTGAVNSGIRLTRNDVLVLNQDITLEGTEWMKLLIVHRERYALIGERIKGNHPAYPNGYVHGTFQFMRRDAINAVGLMDEVNYPLWGASALWQWQICRKDFQSLPLATIPGMTHYRDAVKPSRFGSSIQQLLARESDSQNWFIRTPPAISVIVPCYNYGRFLMDCLNSLFGGSTCLGEHPGQTFQSFEVIIVDDGSTDNTAKIAELYLDGWKGVRYIRQDNRGMPAALNTGIRSAIGKYITILSADDMREPWSLEDLYKASVENPDTVIYDNPTEFRYKVRGPEWQLPDYDFEQLLDRNHMHSGIMFPRTAWEKVGGYSEKMRYGREDWQFNVALGRVGYCGKKVARSGYLYRREEHNRSMGNAGGEWRQFFVMQMREHFPDLYSGVRPMNCCGGGKKPSAAKQSGGRSMKPLASGTDMVLVEFLGTSSGSSNWGGPGTTPSGRYYRFGNNVRDKVKYVEEQDVQWFENHRGEAGKKLFQRKKVAEILPALGNMVDSSGELKAVLVRRPEEEPMQPDGEEDVFHEAYIEAAPEPMLEPVPPAVVDFPDPSTLTVAEVKALDLTPEQWQKLMEAEIQGRYRIGVLDFVESKLK